MIKAIIFDFWGTLVSTGIYSPVKQVRWILGLRMPFSEYIIKFEEAFMLKKFNSLAEAFENVCNAFDVEPNKEVIDKLIGIWNKNRLLAQPFEESVNVLEELKKNYRLTLVSNTNCFSIEPVMEKFNLRDYFDAVVLSYEVGMLKTNPKMFELVLKKLRLKKEDVVMVGDSIASDIKGAEAAGIKAVLVDRRGTRDYKNKISKLTELKSFLKS
jgi:2-haloalkanoic acid dehalogenase type II